MLGTVLCMLGCVLSPALYGGGSKLWCRLVPSNTAVLWRLVGREISREESAMSERATAGRAAQITPELLGLGPVDAVIDIGDGRRLLRRIFEFQEDKFSYCTGGYSNVGT